MRKSEVEYLHKGMEVVVCSALDAGSCALDAARHIKLSSRPEQCYWGANYRLATLEENRQLIKDCSFIVVDSGVNILSCVCYLISTSSNCAPRVISGGEGIVTWTLLTSDMDRAVAAAELAVAYVNSLTAESDAECSLLLEIPSVHLEHSSDLVSRVVPSQIATELVVPLSREPNALWRSIRKSYPAAINSPKARQLDVSVVNSKSPNLYDVWRDFRDLHRRTAGRATRGQRSWDAHLSSAYNEGCLLVTAELGGILVGVGAFEKGVGTCLYSTGVFDRGLMAEGFPLGHVIVWRAMEYLRGERVSGLSMGMSSGSPTSKEANIQFFKSGFGGEQLQHQLLILGQR